MALVTLSAVIHREGDLYVAECPELGTVSQGKTLEEAVANLEEATGLYLEEQDEPPSPASGPSERPGSAAGQVRLDPSPNGEGYP
jgi:predicted RNase H-like HicB family nuclease